MIGTRRASRGWSNSSTNAPARGRVELIRPEFDHRKPAAACRQLVQGVAAAPRPTRCGFAMVFILPRSGPVAALTVHYPFGSVKPPDLPGVRGQGEPTTCDYYSQRPQRFCARGEALGEATMATVDFGHDRPQDARSLSRWRRRTPRTSVTGRRSLSGLPDTEPDGEGTEGNASGIRVWHGVSESRAAGMRRPTASARPPTTSTARPGATRGAHTECGDDEAGTQARQSQRHDRTIRCPTGSEGT